MNSWNLLEYVHLHKCVRLSQNQFEIQNIYVQYVHVSMLHITAINDSWYIQVGHCLFCQSQAYKMILSAIVSTNFKTHIKSLYIWFITNTHNCYKRIDVNKGSYQQVVFLWMSSIMS